MDYYNLLKGVFGFKDIKRDNQSQRQDDKPYGSMPDEFRNPIWNLDEDDDDDFRTRSSHSSFGYQIFSDPIEIHRHFEHQMEAMSSLFDSMFGGGFFQSLPPIEGSDIHEENQNLREKYLKPNYWHSFPKIEWSPDKSKRKMQLDDDLDDRVSAGELDQILKDKPCLENSEPHVQMRDFGNFSFSKIIRNSDGTVEQHHTVRDSRGNEEVTVTKQIGDKKYYVTTRTDSKGEKQQIENFVNMQQEDLDEFMKKWFDHHQAPKHPKIDNEWKLDDASIFDEFFK